MNKICNDFNSLAVHTFYLISTDVSLTHRGKQIEFLSFKQTRGRHNPSCLSHTTKHWLLFSVRHVVLPWKVSSFGSSTQVWVLEHEHQLSILHEVTNPPSSRGSVLLFNGKSALQTQLNCSSGMKFNFHIVQCHADTVKFHCKYWYEKYLLRALIHAIFHTFFCITKLYTQPVRNKFHPHSLVILIKHALKNLQSFSHHWKCVIENCLQDVFS